MPDELLTADEHRAIDLLSELNGLLGRIVGREEPARGNDLFELASHTHVLQNAVLSQAAARAYPDRYRPLGGALFEAVADA